MTICLKLVSILAFAAWLPSWAIAQQEADLTGQSLPAVQIPAEPNVAKNTLKAEAQTNDSQGLPPIARLFLHRCVSCHSGSEAEGDVDLTRPSLIARNEHGQVDLENSRLWEVVHDEEMPPENPLDAAEKQILREWLESGAPNGFEPIDLFRFTTDSRAGYDWWAFQPIAGDKIENVPHVANASRVRTPVDAFVLQQLEDHQLAMSADAPPRDQIRRLYFDLTGLPAPPEIIESFTANPSDANYLQIVDELLDSSAYGERWARHWLDIVRYGESDGFERNGPRLESWRYRDWVINAFNRDLPMDEFARLQIAGDVIAEDPWEGAVATGFLVAGVHNTVVGSSPQMKLLARQDELEDLVGTVGQTFVGLTFNCARCHDHKFDPITQLEYYQLVASLAGVQHGVKSVAQAADSRRLETLDTQITEWQRQHDTIEDAARHEILSRREDDIAVASTVTPALAEWIFNAAPGAHQNRPTESWQILQLNGDARLSSEGLRLDGVDDFASTGPIPIAIKAKTLAAWVSLNDLNQRGGAAISLETPDGALFDAVVFGEKEQGHWMAGSNGFSRTREFAGTPETEADKPLFIALTYAEDGTITAYRNGVPYGTPYQTVGPQTFNADQSRILFGLRHSPAGGNRLLSGSVLRAHLYDRALTPNEIATLALTAINHVSQDELINELTPQQRQTRASLIDQIQKATAQRDQIQTSSLKTIYTAVSSTPDDIRFLPRGDVLSPGESVQPGTTAAISQLSPAFELPENSAESERRLALANWITSEQNPLFSRVMVNRIWHYHFGTGLIATPNDFGFNGGTPSHSELLDWLAQEFKNGGYRLKALHRVIVTSSVYRQASFYNRQSAAHDAESRWLWRKPPVRLEAEVVRDTILALSGKLNSQMGGPGFMDVKIIDQNNGTTYYDSFYEDDPATNRRTLYRFTPRGGRSALLDSLDCPDPSAATPRRSVTTTPLQALSLLNNDFILAMSESFAKRAMTAAPADLEGQLRWMFRMALGRLPDETELAAARDLASRHNLPSVARALFNCNEFIIVQ